MELRDYATTQLRKYVYIYKYANMQIRKYVNT